MSTVVFGAWNDAHDCLREPEHTGDHRCGGWDGWRESSDGRPGCGDVWNQDPYDVEDCNDPTFVTERAQNYPESDRCCTPARVG